MLWFVQGARVMSDVNAFNWAEAEEKNSHWATNYFVATGIMTVLLLTRNLTLMNLAQQASKHLHEIILYKVLRASIPNFFDTHTVGEVLNRFSKDLETVDLSVPEYMMQLFQNWFMIASIFALCLWSTPIVGTLFLPLGALFFMVYTNFRAVSRELKRFEGVSRTPVYTSFTETLAGLQTIRAYGMVDKFRAEHLSRMDQNLKYFFHLWMSLTWVTARLEFLGALALAGTALFAVLFSQLQSVDPKLLGLALALTPQLSGLFQRCVQVLIDLEQYMVSAERILEYEHLEQEPMTLGQEAPATWPVGGVTFQNACLRYRNGPPVLQGVTFHVEPGERVGICGRTGSGKSTLFVALMRVVDLESGQILVDGTDLSTVSLDTIRSRIAIIPQDPVVLSGTLRGALDPLGKNSDAELMGAVQEVGLASLLEGDGLETALTEGGQNLSQGERQLLCVARAFLRRCSILLLDEATASVDRHSEVAVQHLLRARADFRPTVLTIAHRLETIVDYDKIVVLQAGVVKEFGPPQVLLNTEGGLFREMLHSSTGGGT